MKQLRVHLLSFAVIGALIGLTSENTFIRGYAVGFAVAGIMAALITYYPRYNKK